MFVDYIMNGKGSGPVAEQLVNCQYDTGYLRPYYDERGQRCVTVNSRRQRWDKAQEKYVPVYTKQRISDLMNRGIMSPVFNATTLRKEEWIQVDRAVMGSARLRLRAWADLSAAAPYGGFNGMSKTILEHEVMSDPGEALVDMDGLSYGRNDAPRFQLRGIPLPITHSDFSFGLRKLSESRNSGTPLDMSLAESAAQRVAEKIEETLIGTATGITYGGGSNVPTYDLSSKVFGYTNYTNRNTKTDLTVPTGSNAGSTLTDVLEMLEVMYNDRFFGPFMLYHSTDWDQYLDNDYILTGGNVATQTLRQRLRAIDNIQDVRRLDFLSSTTNPLTLLMVQMTSDVAQAVNGMDITTVQWETVGGLQINFKVMCIQVPRLKSDFSGRCGIVHATTS